MEGFSLADLAMQDFQRRTDARTALMPAAPWSEEEATEKARRKRLRQTENDFFAFDRTYFTPDMYPDYSEPGRFQREIVRIASIPGVQIVAGARKHAKTATAKKLATFYLLTGKHKLIGTLSQTLPTSRNILSDLYWLIADNPRLLHDYQIEWIEANEDKLSLRVIRPDRRPHMCHVQAFSEGRSVRGYARGFARPEWLLCDDLETRQSPLDPDHVRSRAAFLAEAKSSLTDDGTIIVLANNFDERCLTNTLLDEQERGVLPTSWRVHVFPAWDSEQNTPLWPERYPVTSEDELRAILDPADQSEWSGDYQQDPEPPDGPIFSREYYAEYDTLPTDARGVLFTDPNLALKGKGDETAIVMYFYSPTHDLFFVPRWIVESYSDSDKLLNDALHTKGAMEPGTVFRTGFDGNVTQESTWSNNIRNWCRIHGKPFPHVEFQKINVDLFAKNIQAYWVRGKVRFPRGSMQNPKSKREIEMIFKFAGKKKKRKDDFPDALINAHELICSSGFVRHQTTETTTKAETFTDFYRF